jgi:ribosomal subunit interface protein
MQITVAGSRSDVSDALRSRIASYMDRIAERYFTHAQEARVVFGRARSFATCDISLSVANGLLLCGEGEAADAPGAFDDAMEHIRRRLRRYRRRVRQHARDLAHRPRPEAGHRYLLRPASPGAMQQEDEANAPLPTYATVVAEQDMQVSTLSVGEAVMQLDLADRTVLMFRNSATDEINVVYRRSDGLVGWLDPSAG